MECLDKKAGTLIAAKTKSGSRQRISRLLSALSEQAEQRKKNGVLLVIDELGKFLEASAGDGDDVYFYQELAELAARTKGKIVVVGVLHQSFEQYASRLGAETRDDWRKIQGRYVDIPLVAASDEVVELVGRAIESEHLHPESWEICNQVSQSIRHNRPSLNQNFASRLDLCWPLHPVTATLLGPISKRRFGQNERSTFGFLASAESRSLKEFLELTPAHEKKTYTPSDFFDYLRSNFEPSILSSPDGHRWSQSVEAVERVGHKKVEGDFHLRLIKTIALIDMFRSNSGLIADEGTLAASLLTAHGEPSSTAKVQELLQDLRRWAVIIYKRHIGSWSIAEGSDFDLDEALSQTLSAIDEPDLSQIAKLVQLSPILAKRHYCETGTLRWMVPVMSHFHQLLHSMTQASTLLKDKLNSSAFGVFLLVLPARGHSVPQTIKAIKKDASLRDLHLPILIGVPRNGESIREFGRELVAYDQIRTGRSELENDAVARRELQARIAEVRSRVEEEVRDALTNIQWVNLDDLPLNVDGARPGTVSLPQLASMLADRRFSSSPLIFSELVNRDSLSSNSAKARKELLYAMLRSGSEERLGFEGYPAEAGLYHNILEASGLHQKNTLSRQADGQGGYAFSDPAEASLNFPRSKSFIKLWSSAINLVVGSTRPVPLLELYALWQAPPFGVRAGVLPIIWLAFSLANQQRVAIYKDGMFIAELREVDVDEAIRDPSRFELRYVQIDEHKREILDGIASHLRHIGQEIGPEPLEAARGLVALVYGLPLCVAADRKLTQ
ncbi:ATP-binding protein [Pseudomonas syringae group genomosp. 3]|uniref:ATP-binding protein n=1 Tax=Pseudomonas syringae group genomosp. 3 TaxID=251701 RepID=A0A2K4WBC1_9PSED|nr:ATP-binding protein [Pseudomonas syringae group genomosp. 3]